MTVTGGDCPHDLKATRQKGPHIEEFCGHCGKHLRWVPKAEAGVERRNVRSLEGVKPSVRAKVFDRYGNACFTCGRFAEHGVLLQLDHIISVELAKRYGVYDELIESDWNLVPLCEECNLGKGAELFSAATVRLMYRALLIASKRAE